VSGIAILIHGISFLAKSSVIVVTAIKVIPGRAIAPIRSAGAGEDVVDALDVSDWLDDLNLGIES
jgi:hypothetical protein